MQNRFPRGLLFLALLFCAHNVVALVAPDLRPSNAPEQRIAALEQQVADAKGSADNAWMLTSSALVLMMTGPGPGPVLLPLSAKEERALHHDAKFRDDGSHHCIVGALWLQPRIRRRLEFYRELPAFVFAWRYGAA